MTKAKVFNQAQLSAVNRESTIVFILDFSS